MIEIKEAIELALPRIGIRLQNELILASPVDTGRLRNSIVVTTEGSTIFIRMVDYAYFVEFGSVPHIIKPKDKQALKFKAGGKEVFAKVVKHPGSRPNPFIRNTLNNKIGKIIQEEILRVIS